MKLLVCGGRDFCQAPNLYIKLHEINRESPISAIIHGAARGADKMAGHWAERNGIHEIACPADWAAHGRAAGPIRNQMMVDEHQPDMVLACHGGRGTLDMVRRAERAGVPVVRLQS